MARVFIDGFEAGDMKLWDAESGTPAIATGITGMDGTYCLNCNHYAADYVGKDVPEAAEYYVAFRYRPVDWNTYSGGIIGFYNGSTRLGYLRLYSGELRVYRGDATLLASGGAISVGTTYRIEVRYKALNSGGIFQVKVDGILVIDYSGDTTAGVEIIDVIRFGCVTESFCMAYFDNVVVDDAAWPGNTRIQAIVPAGAGNSTQWTPSAGDNYACVDEVPPSEADYVSTNTVDHLDLYAAGDLSGTIGAVKCVQVQSLAKAEGAPTPTHLQLAVRTGGSDFVSDDKEPGSASKQLAHIWETNPDTLAAWQESEVNAMEIGVKAAA